MLTDWDHIEVHDATSSLTSQQSSVEAIFETKNQKALSGGMRGMGERLTNS